jgi:hypothetical protein
MDASRSFVGIDADLWTAMGAFAGPLLAVLLGLWVFRIQQQSQYASQRFLADGIQKLFGTLSTLLSIHLLNYQIGSYIIRSLKTYELGHPLAPKAHEIPRFLGLELDSLPIDSVLPVQELIGDQVVLDWVMLAASDVTLEAKEGEFQIRQPVAAYYRSDPETTRLDVDEADRRLKLILEGWNSRLSTHFALLDGLHDLASHVAKKRPWTVQGYYTVWKRSEIGKIREKMRRGYEAAQKAHEDTDDTLKSGGAAKRSAAHPHRL